MHNAEPIQGVATAGRGFTSVAGSHAKQTEFGRFPSADLIREQGGDAVLGYPEALREAVPAA